MLSPSVASSLEVGVPASVSVNELGTLVGGVAPEARTSAQQQQAQQRTLAVLSSGGTLAENMGKAKQLGLHNLAFAHRVDDLNIAAGGGRGINKTTGPAQKTDQPNTNSGREKSNETLKEGFPEGTREEGVGVTVTAGAEREAAASRPTPVAPPRADQKNLPQEVVDRSIAAFLRETKQGDSSAVASLQGMNPAAAQRLLDLRQRGASSAVQGQLTDSRLDNAAASVASLAINLAEQPRELVAAGREGRPASERQLRAQEFGRTQGASLDLHGVRGEQRTAQLSGQAVNLSDPTASTQEPEEEQRRVTFA